MLQRSTGATSGAITAEDTDAHPFDDVPVMAVTFEADANNAGMVTLLGNDGSDDGIVLGAGGRFTPPSFITSLKQFQYQFTNTGDVLRYLGTR